MKLQIFIIGLLMIGCNSTEVQSVDKERQQTVYNAGDQKETVLQNGDLIFHTSRSNQSEAIQLATNSAYSHMGIVYKEGNTFYVYEAIQPVKLTKLDDWINRGEDGKYVVKRLKNSHQYLTKEGIQNMKKIGQQYLGKNYDLKFEWSDEQIYCSELVWKIYKEAFNIEIGTLEKFGDFDLSNQTVQKKVKERFGKELPKEELVITPDRMFKSEKLFLVKER